MKLNPALTCVKSYNAFDKEIIKHIVNRNGEDLSIFIDDDKPQDIVKGIKSMLEHKTTKLRHCNFNKCNAFG